MIKTNFETIKIQIIDQACHITLNRPDVRNALNKQMILELIEAFEMIDELRGFRVVTLSGEGKGFCAGADLNWMKESLHLSREENVQDAQTLYTLFELIDTCYCPVVAGVHGYVPGGAIGLVCACDYVVAEKHSKLSFSEVRLGIVPAIIGPFLRRKIGPSWCRAQFLSAEPFEAKKAMMMGLVHEIVDSIEELAPVVDRLVTSICAASPLAVRTAKTFLKDLAGRSEDDQAQLAVETLADIRVSDDGQEGIAAFLEKRTPNWPKGGPS